MAKKYYFNNVGRLINPFDESTAFSCLAEDIQVARHKLNQYMKLQEKKQEEAYEHGIELREEFDNWNRGI